VKWVPTEVTGSERIVLHKRVALYDQEMEIHWLSIVNSVMLVVLLVMALVVVLFRTLRDDITRYLEVEEDDFLDDSEEVRLSLCSLLSALCSLLSALCSLLCALCSLLCALCSLLSLPTLHSLII
jgi:hypothetical protein